MNITIQQLIEAIALKFNMPPQYDLEYRVALQVMMLPENHLTQLFAQLAYELNIERSVLQSTSCRIFQQLRIQTPQQFATRTMRQGSKELAHGRSPKLILSSSSGSSPGLGKRFIFSARIPKLMVRVTKYSCAS
ncbi:Hypothetical_protein [Hexamita inflata]|uniref:Hypothetical_protein n=1 Tax=Hexamita inflata TaxID=28002 RepID=A0AA86PX48_9EUKA|nr:Hypothetical protein HINF_LOCUS29679 [Hexamita inflata]